MKQLKLLLMVVLCMISSLQLIRAELETGTIDRIKVNLMCTCGCPHQLGQCGDECGVAPKLLADIEGILDSGKSEADVYETYEARYGAVVFSAPKAEGFSLAAWILPFAGLLAGGFVVWEVARRLRPANQTVRNEKEAERMEIPGKYKEMLDRELAE